MRTIADLLEYPTEGLTELLKSAVGLKEIEEFAREALSRDLYELQAIYVETFDMSRETNLYLSYHIYGERSKRGLALAGLIELYSKYKFEYDKNELPDYIPTVLKFAASCSGECLEDKRFKALMAMLEKALDRIEANMPSGNPYVHLIKAAKAALAELGLHSRSKRGGSRPVHGKRQEARRR